MTYENIRVVAYDLDGTILDTVPYKLAQNQQLAREFGREITVGQAREIWNEASGFTDLMAKTCGTDDMAKIMPVVERDYNKPEFQKRRFDYTDRVLSDASLGRRFGSALITNATRQILQLDQESLALPPLNTCFGFVQSAEDSEFKKPDPRVFERMLGYFGVAAADVVYIGDELKDAEAALGAGLQFIGVETGLTTKDEFATRGILSVAALPDALRFIR